MEKVSAGNWVEIHKIILEADERAPQVPEDTKKVPLELRVKGFLVEDAKVGEEAEIETFTGRRHKGTLKDADPSYDHKFGKPIKELQKVGPQIRNIIRDKEV